MHRKVLCLIAFDFVLGFFFACVDGIGLKSRSRRKYFNNVPADSPSFGIPADMITHFELRRRHINAYERALRALPVKDESRVVRASRRVH